MKREEILEYALMLMIAITSAAIISYILTIREIGKVNQAYNRATNCFAATSPPKRTADYVKECYDKAERAAGLKVERYGDGL